MPQFAVDDRSRRHTPAAARRRGLRGDFAPGFFVDHIVKDLGIAIEEAEKLGLQLPGLEHAKKMYEYLQSLDYGSSGTQALIIALARLNNVEWIH